MVLVLMGIILSMTTLSVGDGGKYRELEEEANRLKTLINMAREEAILRSQDWVIAFTKDAYRFEQEEDKGEEHADPRSTPGNETNKVKYVPIKDSLFRERELAGYQLSLFIDEQAYIEKPEAEGEDEEDVLGRIYIYSSGELSDSFEVNLEQEDGEDKFTLKANLFGELDLKSSRDEGI